MKPSYNPFRSAIIFRSAFRWSLSKFLLIFVQQIQKMNVLLMRQIDEQIPKAAPLAYSVRRIRCPGLTKAASSFDRVPTFGVLDQVILYLPKYIIRGSLGELSQPMREHMGLYEYHAVGYTTL